MDQKRNLMIEKNDVPAIARAVSELVSRCVTAAMATVRTRIDQLEKRLSEIPAGPQGLKGIDGAPGLNGKDAVVDTSAIIAAVVKGRRKRPS